MTKEEYDKRVATLKNEHDKAIRELSKEYVLSNNPHKPGDVVADHTGSIVIDRVFISYRPLCAVYQGRELKKDGTVKKNKKVRQVYQSNLYLAVK